MLSTVVAAQSGRIRGQVVESRTKSPLASARVSVEGSDLYVISNVKGEFVFDAVAPGSKRLTANYLGYKSTTLPLTVVADEEVTLTFSMEADVAEIGAMTIVGRREGQIKALNQRKNALNVVDVAASDLMGKFPDTNPAEALGRMPGVALDRDGGEGRMVKIRGGESRFVSARVNGVQVGGAETHTRTSQLDVIGNASFDRVELHKVLSPDMDMDAISGVVNLVTKEAASERVVNATVSSGYHDGAAQKNWSSLQSAGHMNKHNPNVGLGFDGMAINGSVQTGGRAMDGKLGVMIGLSTDNYNQGYHSYNLYWNEADLGNKLTTPMFDQMRTYDYAIFRSRNSLNVAADYKIDENNVLYGSMTYSQFNDFEFYKNLRLTSIKGASESGFSSGKLSWYHKDRLEYQQNKILTVLGEHKNLADLFTLDWQFAFSEANETEPNRLDARFDYDSGSVKGSWDYDPEFIQITSLQDSSSSRSDIHRDYRAFKFNQMATEDDSTTDKDWTGSADLTFPMPLNTDFKLTLKTGAKGRFKRKWVKDSLRTYKDVSGDSYSAPRLDAFTGGFQTTTGSFGSDDNLYFMAADAPDFEKLRWWFHEQREKGMLDYSKSDYQTRSFPNNYVGEEMSMAGYGMASLEAGIISARAGLRYETTDWTYDARKLMYDSTGAYVGWARTQQDGRYGFLLPALLVKATPFENFNARLGLTRSY
jgi:TonB-dependent receptor